MENVGHDGRNWPNLDFTLSSSDVGPTLAELALMPNGLAIGAITAQDPNPNAPDSSARSHSPPIPRMAASGF